MIAVIETGGKQYVVEPGKELILEKLDVPEGKEVIFDKVLLVEGKGGVMIGKPLVEGVKVKARVLEHGKGKKIIVFRYRPKTRYKKKKGHRQPYTKVKIEEIILSGS